MHKSQKIMSIKSWPLAFLYQNEVRLKILFRPKLRLYLRILVNSKSKCFQVIDWMFRVASHMEFNFPKKEGSGIAKLIPNVSAEA